jgi:hypothetical protein
MDHPPPKLAKLLEELGLATAGQVASVAGRARRLARQLPLLESVWLDALVQVRCLTPWQSLELKAGRGDRLRVGPFVLESPLDWPDFGLAYRARRIDDHAAFRVVILAGRPSMPDPVGRLEVLAARAPELARPGVTPIVAAGADGDRCWCASPASDGIPLSQWMIHHGRFPPQAVLEIARQMVAALAALEKAGVCHGDLSPRGVLLTDTGLIELLQPGLRAIVRPVEGCSQAELRPEAYDYLAPERAVDGTSPTPAADLYAAACVWWHLLAGRAPRMGGTSLAKLQAAANGRLPDIGQLVQAIPCALTDAIAACTERRPDARPPSFTRLAAELGPADRSGRASLRRCAAGAEGPLTLFDPFPAVRRRKRAPGAAPAVGAGLLAVVAAIVGLVWYGRSAPSPRPETQAVASAIPRPIPTPEKAPPPDSVVQASHVVPSPATPAGPTPAESIPLKAGTHIGTAAKRLQLVLPAAGWLVSVEDVCFENVDFEWHAAGADVRPADGAMIRLHAGRAEFRGCTFRGGEVPVIRWVHPADEANSPLVLPSGRLRFLDCVFHKVGTVVACQARGAVAIEFSNTLHVEGGPLVRAARWPTAEESLRISLARTTLRETDGVLDCPYQADLASPGPIVVQTVQSGLFPCRGKALLTLAGAEPPGRVVEAVEWSGEGSLIGMEAPVAVWRGPDAGVHPVDDSRLAISGVARSTVEFAGPPAQGPAASRITQWQGPLRSPDPPGADSSRLPALTPIAKGS